MGFELAYLELTLDHSKGHCGHLERRITIYFGLLVKQISRSGLQLVLIKWNIVPLLKFEVEKYSVWNINFVKPMSNIKDNYQIKPPAFLTQDLSSDILLNLAECQIGDRLIVS